MQFPPDQHARRIGAIGVPTSFWQADVQGFWFARDTGAAQNQKIGVAKIESG